MARGPQMESENAEEPIVYPDSDGEPMADNPKQFRWIVMLKENLDHALPDAFVAGNHLWYPVEGRPDIRRGPDVLVAFGRPKGDRGSYRQWVEDGVAPQVVIEVRSPGNTSQEMRDKLAFYDEYGASEYYVVDPDAETLEVYLDGGDGLRRVPVLTTFRSPWMQVDFDVRDGLRIFHRDGSQFLTFQELWDRQDEAVGERDRVIEERDRVVEQLDHLAEQRNHAVEQRDRAVEQRDRLLEQLRAAGIEPDLD